MTDAALHNIEAEQALLGAVLVNNAVFDRVSTQADDFYDPLHAQIWAEITRRIIDGGTAAPTLLAPAFEGHEGMKELGGVGYLAKLAGSAVAVSTAPEYAAQVSDLARRREMAAALDRAREALGRAESPEDVAAATEAEMMFIHDKARPQARSVSMMRAASEMLDRARAAYHEEGPGGVPTGIAELDDATGGMMPGELWILGGRPSMGKTAIALAMAMGAGRAGRNAWFASMEMLPADLTMRVASCIAAEAGVRVPYEDIRSASRLSEDQMRALVMATQGAAALPIKVSPPKMRGLGALMAEGRAIERRLKADGKTLDLIVVDYLQLIETGHEKAYDRASAAVKAMKNLAIRHECPVICLSQLSRQVEQRDNKRPIPSDLRDSGEIEQDADVILFAYRDE